MLLGMLKTHSIIVIGGELMSYKQITLDEYLKEYEATIEDDPCEDDPCKDCTDRTCEWGICSQANK